MSESPAEGICRAFGVVASGAYGHRVRDLANAETLPHPDLVGVLDGLLVQLPQTLPTALNRVALGDLGDRVAALDAHGLGCGGSSRSLLDDGLLRGRLGLAPGVGVGGRAAVGLAVALRQACPTAADRPGAGALRREHPPGDRNLLGLAGAVGARGVLAATEAAPGPAGELQSAVVAVTGVDLPVATALAGGDPVPHGSGGAGRGAADGGDADSEGDGGDDADEALDDRGRQQNVSTLS